MDLTSSNRQSNDGRYQSPLYVSDKQIIERMGVGINAGRKALQTMRLDPGFPSRTIGGKRYWPSVVDFLDRWNGRLLCEPTKAPLSASYRGRVYEELELAEQRVKKRTKDAVAIDRQFAAIETSIGRRLDPALMDDPELRAFLLVEAVRMADKNSRRRPSLDAGKVAAAESRLSARLELRDGDG